MIFQAIIKSPKDQPLLIQSNQNANIIIPRTIKWSEISPPSDWSLTNESKPIDIQNNLVNLDNIQQYFDGTVKIHFNPPASKSSVQLHELSQSTRFKEPVRNSVSGSASTDMLGRDQELINDLVNMRLKSIKTNSQVTHPCYENPSQTKTLQEEQTSPTTDFE